MKTQKYDFTSLKVAISKNQKDKAKAFAKSKGYAFGFWVGSLIERELENAKKEEASHDSAN